jgi:hypothetical protein
LNCLQRPVGRSSLRGPSDTSQEFFLSLQGFIALPLAKLLKPVPDNNFVK